MILLFVCLLVVYIKRARVCVCACVRICVFLPKKTHPHSLERTLYNTAPASYSCWGQNNNHYSY